MAIRRGTLNLPALLRTSEQLLARTRAALGAETASATPAGAKPEKKGKSTASAAEERKGGPRRRNAAAASTTTVADSARGDSKAASQTDHVGHAESAAGSAGGSVEADAEFAPGARLPENADSLEAELEEWLWGIRRRGMQ